jgi:hypothetical protein
MPDLLVCLIHEIFSARYEAEVHDLDMICLNGLVTGHACA